MRINGARIAHNKSASFHYEILNDLEAGIVLTGSEVKSLRLHNPHMGDAYATFIGRELFLKNFNIPIVTFGSLFKKHDSNREKKLLLHKNELIKLKNNLVKGLTIIPLDIYFNKQGFVKVKLANAKGKKLFDKREDIKSKDIKRESAMAIKSCFKTD